MISLEQKETPKTITPSPQPSPRTAPGDVFSAADARVVTTMWALCVWTYQRQKAHLGAGSVGAAGYGSISPTGAVLERLRLGVSVDGGGRAFGGSSGAGSVCDGDALAVHGFVARMGRHARTVIDAAASGGAPDWNPAYPPARTAPVLNGKGKPKMIYDANRNPIACKLELSGFSPQRAREWVETHRERYTAWWVALSVLHDVMVELQPLRRWRVVGVGAQPEPWRR